MMTRWNKNDLAGYLLEQAKQGGEKWEVLTIPAIDEQGNEIIWPGKWDKGYIQQEKENISSKDWAALYQQDPIASSSNIFRLQDFRYHLSSDFERADGILKKEDLRCIIAVDPAFSTSKTSDDAVVMAWGKHKISGNYYLLDGYADTSAPSHTFQAILSMYDRVTADGYKMDFISIESVSISKDQTKFVTDFKSFLKERNRYLTVNEWKPEGKKEERIKFVLEPKASLNAISLRKDMADASFVRKFENQIVDFPHGKHDDVIDCAAQAVDVLDKKGQLPDSASKKIPMYFNRQTGRLEPVKSK
jgi:phage terminase large subunit-like protein